MRILLDMDEVIVDFYDGIAHLYGYDREKFRQARMKLPSTWDSTPSLGITHAQFWEPINTMGADIWVQLPPKPWLRSLIDIIDFNSNGDWYIVTNPSLEFSESALRGKELWMRRHLPEYIDRLVPTKHKHVLARQGVVLIDDNEDNCAKFQEHHGDAIVFPAIGNSRYTMANDPLPFVAHGLKTISLAKPIRCRHCGSTRNKEITNAPQIS